MWAGIEIRLVAIIIASGWVGYAQIQYSPDPLASVMFRIYSCMSLVSSSLKPENRLAEYCEQR